MKRARSGMEEGQSWWNAEDGFFVKVEISLGRRKRKRGIGGLILGFYSFFIFYVFLR